MKNNNLVMIGWMVFIVLGGCAGSSSEKEANHGESHDALRDQIIAYSKGDTLDPNTFRSLEYSIDSKYNTAPDRFLTSEDVSSLKRLLISEHLLLLSQTLDKWCESFGATARKSSITIYKDMLRPFQEEEKYTRFADEGQISRCLDLIKGYERFFESRAKASSYIRESEFSQRAFNKYDEEIDFFYNTSPYGSNAYVLEEMGELDQLLSDHQSTHENFVDSKANCGNVIAMPFGNNTFYRIACQIQEEWNNYYEFLEVYRDTTELEISMASVQSIIDKINPHQKTLSKSRSYGSQYTGFMTDLQANLNYLDSVNIKRKRVELNKE